MNTMTRFWACKTQLQIIGGIEIVSPSISKVSVITNNRNFFFYLRTWTGPASMQLVEAVYVHTKLREMMKPDQTLSKEWWMQQSLWDRNMQQYLLQTKMSKTSIEALGWWFSAPKATITFPCSKLWTYALQRTTPCLWVRVTAARDAVPR